jgi:hypothetical protein
MKIYFAGKIGEKRERQFSHLLHNRLVSYYYHSSENDPEIKVLVERAENNENISGVGGGPTVPKENDDREG